MFLNPVFAVGVLGGYSFHRYCDNDWDILGTNKAESRAIHELWILGYLIYGISSIYGAIFMRHHRSIQTHFPVVSTIIRLVFLFWWIPLMIYLNHWIVQTWQWFIFFGFWWGLSQADAIHWLADMFWSEDSKRWVQQDKEKKWRNGYHKHIHTRTNVTHKFNNQGQIDEQID